jgi:uncharacterized surface protein with fasciclin (FAS1) repeats
MISIRLSTLTLALLMAGAAQAQIPANTPTPPVVAAANPPIVAAGDIVETLKASGQFTIFLKCTDATNLTAFIKAQKNMTLFAPTDAAFRSAPSADIARVMSVAGRGELQKLLLYHMVNAAVPSAEFKGAVRTAPTLAGTPVQLNGGQKLMVNDVDIAQADVMGTNGVVHVVGKLLTPGWTPPVEAAPPEVHGPVHAPPK